MSLQQREPGASSRVLTAVRRLALTGAMLLTMGTVQAQQAPSLHHRAAEQQDPPVTTATATGHIELPAQAEGEYPWKSWRGDGEIELYFDGGKVHGYMTEPQSRDNQTGAPLTYDFASTTADGHALSFTTRQLHGTWYSFTGHLERGAAGSSSQPGYYRLTGTITEHGGPADGAAHTVSLPREPGSE